MKISCNSFFCNFCSGSVRMCGCHENAVVDWWEAEKFILNSDCTIILPIMTVKNSIENVDCIFLKRVNSIIFG